MLCSTPCLRKLARQKLSVFLAVILCVKINTAFKRRTFLFWGQARFKMAGVSSLRFSCPVCAKDYTESGEHEAKLLPCTHTVCKHCVENKLFQYFERNLDCPVCNKEHHFCDGVESVPENQYIRVMIKKGDICRRHQKELILFCEERECQIPICGLCLKDDHKGHEFDTLENLSKKLIVEMESLNDTSTEIKEKNESLRLENYRKNKTCKEHIEVARKKTLQSVNKQFDKLVAEVNEAEIKVETKLNDVAEKIKDKLQMEETMEKDVSSRLQAMKSMKTEIANLVTELTSITKNYKYFQFRAGEVSDIDLRDICGVLIQKPFQRNISLQETTSTSNRDVSTTGSPAPKRRRKEAASGGESGSKLNSMLAVNPVPKRRPRETASGEEIRPKCGVPIGSPALEGGLQEAESGRCRGSEFEFKGVKN